MMNWVEDNDMTNRIVSSSTPEIEQFFQNNDETYLVLIFEPPEMYTAREVRIKY